MMPNLGKEVNGALGSIWDTFPFTKAVWQSCGFAASFGQELAPPMGGQRRDELEPMERL